MLKELIGRFCKKPSMFEHPTRENQRKTKRFENKPFRPHTVPQEIDHIIKTHSHNWWLYLPSQISIMELPDFSIKRDRVATIINYGRRDCENFALGESGILYFLPTKYRIVEEPKYGDIVLYVKTTKRKEKTYPHVGRYIEDRFVVSKWGLGGPVLKHPIDYVPTRYGKRTLFFRISNEDDPRIPTMSDLTHGLVVKNKKN